MNVHNLILLAVHIRVKQIILLEMILLTRDVSSFIDNIVFDKKLLNNVNYVDVIDDETNFRDHLAKTSHFHKKKWSQ